MFSAASLAENRAVAAVPPDPAAAARLDRAVQEVSGG
jgi:hypothetical protein